METVSLSTLNGRKYFTSGMPDVTIGGTDGTSLQVTVTCDGVQLLQESLWPVGGIVTLSELGALLEPYARKRLMCQVTITAGGTSAAFSVLYAKADVGISAEDFYNGYFLSVLMGAKITASGRRELLWYYGSDTASVTAGYSDGTRQTFPRHTDRWQQRIYLHRRESRQLRDRRETAGDVHGDGRKQEPALRHGLLQARLRAYPGILQLLRRMGIYLLHGHA